MEHRYYRTKLVKFLQCEKEEIDRLKWIESEKINRDIGYGKAIFLWKTRYRTNWVIQYKKLSG